MKIQVIKKGTVNAKPVSYCDVIVDDIGPDKRVGRRRQGSFPHAAVPELLALGGPCRGRGPVHQPGPPPSTGPTTLRIGIGDSRSKLQAGVRNRRQPSIGLALPPPSRTGGLALG
jgi:hypothetical protein